MKWVLINLVDTGAKNGVVWESLWDVLNTLKDVVSILFT